jgi:hypothetical protein
MSVEREARAGSLNLSRKSHWGRFYAVLLMPQQLGLVEWYNQTNPLRHYL